MPAFEQVEVAIGVRLEPGAKTGEVNTATVSGGGAAGTSRATHEIEVNGPERFGIENYTLVPENMGGSVDTQAGSHPFQVTSVVTANSTTPSGLHEGDPRTVGLAKDYVGELPAGFVGNPTPFEQCTDAQFVTQSQPRNEGGGEQLTTECPASSAIGVALVRYAGPTPGLNESVAQPIFNMVPLPGEPARFAFLVDGDVPVFLNASVRTGSDYGVTLSSHDIIQLVWSVGLQADVLGGPRQ